MWPASYSVWAIRIVRWAPKPSRLEAACCSVLVMNGRRRAAGRALLLDRRTVNGGHLPRWPSIVVRFFAGPLASGSSVVCSRSTTKPSSSAALRASSLLFGFELLAGQLDQLGDERIVLGQPFLALDLGALAVAGVGEEIVPLGRERWQSAGWRLAAVKIPPIFQYSARDERFDLALALDDQPHRHALHPAGAQALGDLAPQQRRNLVADDAVEDAPGLLGVDPVDVDRHRVLERLLDLGLGDGVEDDAVGLGVGDAQGLFEMPGDGLAFAVQVGCQVDLGSLSLASFLSSLTTLLRLSRISYSGSKVLRSTPMPLDGRSRTCPMLAFTM